MKELKKRNRRNNDDLEKQIIDESKRPIKAKTSIRFNKVISTGSTLLDLAIAGSRIRGGGLPGGILIEIYGASAAGKTSLLTSICASAQRKEGEVDIQDPESRLDKEYVEIYGVSIEKSGFTYSRPDTVIQAFSHLRHWAKNIPEGIINVAAIDAVAALSTDLEMDNEEGDKMGMKQAKEFSQNLRKAARLLGQENLITIFNNQVRQGSNGETTPCGRAMEFYGSLRIRVSKKKDISIVRKLKSGKDIEKIIGIQSECYVKKSTIDAPYRSCPLSIIFNYGIDDIRDQMQWYKDMQKATVYECPDGKTYQSMEKAIEYIEDKNLQNALHERTIDLWEEIEDRFKQERKPRVFF